MKFTVCKCKMAGCKRSDIYPCIVIEMSSTEVCICLCGDGCENSLKVSLTSTPVTRMMIRRILSLAKSNDVRMFTCFKQVHIITFSFTSSYDRFRFTQITLLCKSFSFKTFITIPV